LQWNLLSFVSKIKKLKKNPERADGWRPVKPHKGKRNESTSKD
jgi:hypothetical protein